MSERKARARAFVPKMTIRRAVASVLPACALAAATELAACDHPQVIVLAMMAFDASVDGPSALPSSSSSSSPPPPPDEGVIVLAVMAFDAGIDPPAPNADAGAKAKKRPSVPRR